MRRLSEALLAVAVSLAASAGGCGDRAAPPPTGTEAGTSSATVTPTPSAATTTTATTSSARSAPSGSAAARRKKRPAGGLDAACPGPEGDGTPEGQLQVEKKRTACVRRLLDDDLGHLDAKAAGALLDGDPRSARGRTKKIEGSLWATAVAAGCKFHAFQQATHAGTRYWGPHMEAATAGCVREEHARLGDLVRARLVERPGDVVVWFRAAEGRPDPVENLAAWRRYADAARKTAPHGALHPTTLHRLGDDEWLGLERDLDGLERVVKTLAKGTCSGWPDLARAAGGADKCLAAMIALRIPVARELQDDDRFVAAPDGEPDPPDPNAPPPADEAYDADTLSLRRGCAVPAVCFLTELGAARATVAKRRELLTWETHLAPFRDRLCALDLAGGFAASTSDPKLWLDAPKACPSATSLLLTARVLRLVAAKDPKALVAHLEHRKAWGEAVQAGLAAVAKDFAGPCVARGRTEAACGPKTAPLRAKVVTAIEEVREQGKSLGEELCRAAPELKVALGARCPKTASSYLFSLSGVLGDKDLLR